MERHPAISGMNDTSVEAAQVQLRLLRSMSPSRKVSLVEDANRTARRLALAGITLRFPGASTEQRNRMLMNLILGDELAEEVYGPGRGTPQP